MKISSYNKQQGVASLLTAVILLICITLVVLFTSKTVVMDTKMTADNTRTAQATAAAQAAMDQAVAYAIAGGINQYVNATTTPFAVTTTAIDSTHPDTRVDYTSLSPMSISLASGSQTTRAQFYFDNSPGNRCDCAAGNCFASSPMDKALVVAKGWSDDNSATRTVSQCVGSFNILNVDPNTGGAGVPAPLVSVSSITLHGNGTMINRFTQSNIWSGDPAYTIAGQSLGTYLRKSRTQVSDFSLAQLIAPVPSSGDLTGSFDDSALSNYTEVGSNSKSGNGVDVIVGDKTLAQVKFESFFSKTIFETAALAESEGKCYAASSPITISYTDNSVSPPVTTTKQQPCTGGSSIPTTATGLVFADSSASLPAVLGGTTNPIILIGNGNLTVSGLTFYGFMYATGALTVSGNTDIIGSVLSSTPATGNGAISVIYRPMGGTQVDNSGQNTGYELTNFVRKGVISGSWRDW